MYYKLIPIDVKDVDECEENVYVLQGVEEGLLEYLEEIQANPSLDDKTFDEAVHLITKYFHAYL